MNDSGGSGAKPLLRLKPVKRADERRIASRAAIRVPLRLRIPSIDFPFESEAVNVSQTGAFVALEELPPLGTRVDIEISLESGSLLLHATGEVVRHELRRPPKGIGIHFSDVSYEAQALIDRMVADERLFGKYRLEALIGQGGMAEVYSARVLEGEHAGDTVAIKRIRPDLSNNPVMLQLFQKEAEVTRLLRHPLVIEVLDVGKVGDTFYIAMEYVRGCNLSLILDECNQRGIQIPIDFALYVAKTVAEALDYAHNAKAADGSPLGVIHRDVTPGNVFISDIGEIRLGDFGVVLVSEWEEDVAVVGKEPYMAPEMIEHGAALPATDLFSLAAVLFEMLTNRLAFPGTNQKEIWKQILSGDVPVPSALRPEIPPAVDAFFVRALSPKVAGVSRGLTNQVKELFGARKPERFSSAAEFAAALEPLYDPAIGTQMAIASVVRNLLKARR